MLNAMEVGGVRNRRWMQAVNHREGHIYAKAFKDLLKTRS